MLGKSQLRIIFMAVAFVSLGIFLPTDLWAQYGGYSGAMNQRYNRMQNGLPYNHFTGKVQPTTTYRNPLTGRPQKVHLPAAVSPQYQDYPYAGQLPQYPEAGYPQFGPGNPVYNQPGYGPAPYPQPHSSYKPVGPVHGNTSYNPLTGEQISRTITRNPFTGEIQTSAKVVNPLTGQESTYLKSYNPLTGQTNGSSSSYNPLTGQYQESVNGRNPFSGRREGSSAAYQVDPYTGQLVPVPGGTRQWR
jgi:hypothetical protein